jgi:hypothetical protein
MKRSAATTCSGMPYRLRRCLPGGSGNDSLTGGDGHDCLDGGACSDSHCFNRANDLDTIVVSSIPGFLEPTAAAELDSSGFHEDISP